MKEPYDNQLPNEDSRAGMYLAQEDRIIIKDGQIYRQYFGDTGPTAKTTSRLVHSTSARDVCQTPRHR